MPKVYMRYRHDALQLAVENLNARLHNKFKRITVNCVERYLVRVLARFIARRRASARVCLEAAAQIASYASLHR